MYSERAIQTACSLEPTSLRIAQKKNNNNNNNNSNNNHNNTMTRLDLHTSVYNTEDSNPFDTSSYELATFSVWKGIFLLLRNSPMTSYLKKKSPAFICISMCTFYYCYSKPLARVHTHTHTHIYIYIYIYSTSLRLVSSLIICRSVDLRVCI